MPSLKVGHFDKVVCAMNTLPMYVVPGTAIVVFVLVVLAIWLRDALFVVLALLCLIVVVGYELIATTSSDEDKRADRAAEAKRDYDKAKLYFVTHYPDLEVLQFDTYQGLVRFERQDPPRVCVARLIPYDGVFLPGSAEDCAELPQGG